MRALIVAGMVAVLPGAVCGQADLQLPLSQGIYRIEGKCLELKDSISDLLAQCDEHFGIDANDPALPNFIVFTREGKGWMFWSKRAKKVSTDGKHAEYTIKYFTDVTLGSTYDFGGECILDLGEKIRIECRALRGRKLARSVIFESHGTFVFSRTQGSPQANPPPAQ